MKAIILVGGQGTRLRPLTETIKKELLPLVDRAILHHTLDRLVRHGVHEVVMSSSYLEEMFRPFIAERRGDPGITWVTEQQPLDTGGAIVNALEHAGDEAFFALNGDILTDLDLTAMLAFHRERAAVATIALHHVEDARAFGLVPTEPDGRVLEFREKPEERIPGDINAGTYILEPSALEGWVRGEPVSIERQVFPGLIEAGRLVCGFLSEAYWMDLGTPEKYLQAHFDLLEGKVDGRWYPAPFVADGATVHLRAHLGRWVVVGEGADVAEGASVEDSVLHRGARIGPDCMVEGTIVGPRAQVGRGARVTASVLGEGARVPPGAVLEEARVSGQGDPAHPAPA